MTDFASYAADPSTSRGRLYPVPADGIRDEFQRDHDRIIHSRAFRKLQFKTQVFIYHVGDFYRTRLTHTLEVTQITRTACRRLGLNQDLGATVALAHDLGHTPFGHTGEDAVSLCLHRRGLPEFDHNDQALRILTLLENSYPQHAGLNLTWESLEGIAKHNGPVAGDPSPTLAEIDAQMPLDLARPASLEAQVAALCDDIAYNSHDVDDGLRSGLISTDQMRGLPQVGGWITELEGQQISPHQLRFQLARRIISSMVMDVVAQVERETQRLGIETADDVRLAGAQIARFSDELQAWLKPLRKFLFAELYRHPSIKKMRADVSAEVAGLFDLFMDDPSLMPPDWAARCPSPAPATADEAALPGDANFAERAQVVVDYLSGMTDRYALERAEQLLRR